MSDILYWVWLAMKNGAGNTDAIKLLKHFPGGAKEIYEATDAQLSAAAECSTGFLRRLSNHDLKEAENILDFCFMNGIRVVPCCSKRYPRRLRELHNKPIVIYVRGEIEDLDQRFCVSIVGSRSMSGYGKHMAFTLARQLIAYGAIIISGAAYGVDSVANNTAVYLEEPTVAVLGSGIDVPYPQRNKEMLEWIGHTGMVISEYPPHTPPIGSHFPTRNRIISGLSDAVIVVEAGAKSGALITARRAADQNKKVYAVPGNIGAPNSVGTNKMIRDGAKMVTCTEDILEDFAEQFGLAKIERIVNDEKYLRYEYNYHIPILPENMPITPAEQDKMAAVRVPRIIRTGKERELSNIPKPSDYRGISGKSDKAAAVDDTASESHTDAPAVSEKLPEASGATLNANVAGKGNLPDFLDDIQRKVLEAIPDGAAVSSDRIIAGCGLPTEEVLSSLTMLELLSMVEALPGDLYKKIIKRQNKKEK